MNCFGNQHTFAWGSSTTVDATPLSLRCACGVMSGEDIAPLRRLQAENARLRERIEEARHYLSGAIDREVITCACWGASGCDAHELIHDLDQTLAALSPAPGRDGDVRAGRPDPDVRGGVTSMPITYGYRFEVVRLLGRRRQHLVAAIGGDFLPLPGTLGDDVRPVPDWAEIEQEFRATAVDPDRWLVWRAGMTVCGKPAPWTRDVGGNYQHCGRCLELAVEAFDAAPAEARARVAAAPKSPTREI